jgi:hypothetical protein
VDGPYSKREVNVVLSMTYYLENAGRKQQEHFFFMLPITISRMCNHMPVECCKHLQAYQPLLLQNLSCIICVSNLDTRHLSRRASESLRPPLLAYTANRKGLANLVE